MNVRPPYPASKQARRKTKNKEETQQNQINGKRYYTGVARLKKENHAEVALVHWVGGAGAEAGF